MAAGDAMSEARKFSEMFNGGDFVTFMRLFRRLEISEVYFVSMHSNAGHKQSGFIMDANTSKARLTWTLPSAIGRVLRFCSRSKIVPSVISFIHVSMVNRVLGHFPSYPEPNDPMGKKCVAVDANNEIAVNANMARHLPKFSAIATAPTVKTALPNQTAGLWAVIKKSADIFCRENFRHKINIIPINTSVNGWLYA
jgi:hypothetical protein